MATTPRTSRPTSPSGMPLANEAAAARMDIAPYLLVSLVLHLTVLAVWGASMPHSFSTSSADRSFSVTLVSMERPDSATRSDTPPREPAPSIRQPASVEAVKAVEPPGAQPKRTHRTIKRKAKETAPTAEVARRSSEPVAAPAPRGVRPVENIIQTAPAKPTEGSSTTVAATEADKDVQEPGVRAEGVSPETARHLYADLREALARHFHYPLTARRKGLEGEVKVSLRIEPGGELTHIRVWQSSGHAVLDEAAVGTLSKVGRLPQAVPRLGGAYFDLTLPIQYRLVGG